MNIFVQSVGIIAMAVGALALAQKNTKTVLFIQIFSTALFGIHYFLLGAYAGAALNVLSMLRNIIIKQKHKKWASPKIWFPVTVALFAAAVFLSGDGLLGILPFAGCVFMTVGLHIENGGRARRYLILSSPCWLIYNAINISIGGVVAEIINICSILSAVIRFDIKRK